MTWTLIGLNVVVWLIQVLYGAGGGDLIATWGMTPARFFDQGGWQVWVTPLSSMFMHGGWMHIVGNMWFLWIFGDNVEDAFGHAGFVAFYLLGGLCAAGLQFALTTDSPVPMVGASGAIAGVLAAYMCFYPFARVQTLLVIFIFIRFIEVPAFLFIFVWFGFQLLSGCSSIAADTGTAWWAHIGGFIAGYVIARAFKKKALKQGRNLPGGRGGLFTFHVHRPRRRVPPEDDLMPPRNGWKNRGRTP